MKNKIKLLLIAFSVLFISCTEYEYEAPADLTTVSFYNSTGRESEINTGLFSYLTFLDLSKIKFILS